MLVICALVVRKLLVVHESKMTHLLMVSCVTTQGETIASVIVK